jgi:nitrogen fixation protein FixH
MSVVKLLVLLFCVMGLVFAADDREGNFTIRFEPTAKLQTKVEVPFEVRITDDRKQPLQHNAAVELSISPKNQGSTKTIKAWFVQPGVFIAKPVFPSDGQWSVTVTARRENQVSSRVITFSVAN